MTAEADIAAISDGGENTALDVRTAFASVLGRADARLIASTVYDPGTLVIFTTSSATMAEVDTTNLRVTFDAPASGVVVAVFNGLADGTVTTAAAQEWGIMEGGVVIARTRAVNVGSAAQIRANARFIVDGLNGTHVWDWGHAKASGGGDARLFAGGIVGPAVMEIWAA